MKNKKVCLIIRDGWGKGKETDNNAIFKARTPCADNLEKNFPTTLMNASGLAVGLPEGYQGNSEVGHLNIGAGRVVFQSLTRIDMSVKDKTFFNNEAICNAVKNAKENNKTLHLAGLIQEEGVHAVTRHCISILEICKHMDFENVLIHAITDGRDTPPKSAESHMNFLEQGIKKTGIGKIATLTGRYYAMDRDNRWERTETAYNALMHAQGKKHSDWKEALQDAYMEGESDEFIKPRVTDDYRGLEEDDSIIFFNFRFDRTRQLTRALCERDFNAFKVNRIRLHFTAMTHYYDNGNFHEAFPEISYENILGEIIASKGLKQLRISETEKFAHITFFFNALRNDPFENEERILIKSPGVATYDMAPEMSAFEIRDKLTDAIKSEEFGLIICNFANCDMVGHTGKFEKIVKAVETVDTCVAQVVEECDKHGYSCIICADHGNAEQTKLADNSPMTSHTKNPVPLTITGLGKELTLRSGTSLCDIAPTILDIMGIDQPEDMTGKSIIVR